MIGLVLAPLLYCWPQILMTAELSCMMPHPGGYVLWVFRAHGDFAGYINAFNCAFCSAVDNAVYPVLAMSYYESFARSPAGATAAQTPIESATH